jgi:hypothetical protein
MHPNLRYSRDGLTESRASVHRETPLPEQFACQCRADVGILSVGFCMTAVAIPLAVGPRPFAFVLAALLTTLAPSARATSYEWHGGNFSQSGIPNPLTSSDSAILQSPITDGPTFDGDFDNLGTFSYRDSGILFASGVTVINEGEWISLDDHDLLRSNVPTVPIFLNNGTFRKSGGTGSTKIVNLNFFNTGEIRADSGLIELNSTSKTFYDGTQFTGAGRIEISNGATFNGGFTSSNLELRHGTYTGTDAKLTSGSVLWTGGGFAGQWTNQAIINAQDGGGGLGWGAGVAGGVTFTNDDLILCNSGGVVGGDSQITNNGTFELRMPNATTVFLWNNQGSRPTFTNNQILLKTSPGVKSEVLFGDINFVNAGSGVIHVAESTLGNDNTLVFNGPATFEDGTHFEAGSYSSVVVNHDATFKGRYFTSGVIGTFPLVLKSGIFQGVDAHMDGLSTNWQGGTLKGDWTNDQFLGVDSSSPHSIDGHFTNNDYMASITPELSLGAGTVFDNKGEFAIDKDLDINGDVLGATFRNFKELDSTGAQGITTNIRADAINASGATMDIGGTLKFFRSLTQQGTISLYNAVLEVPNGTENNGIIDGTGKLTVTGGGNIINHGYIAPGFSPGTLLIEGDYTHASDAVLEIELQDVANIDHLMVDGNVSLLGGELALFCYTGCNLKVGDTLDILEATGQLTGTFDIVTLNGFGDGWQFDVNYATNMVELSVQSVPEPDTCAMLLAGLGLLQLVMSRRKASARRTS